MGRAGEENGLLRCFLKRMIFFVARLVLEFSFTWHNVLPKFRGLGSSFLIHWLTAPPDSQAILKESPVYETDHQENKYREDAFVKGMADQVLLSRICKERLKFNNKVTSDSVVTSWKLLFEDEEQDKGAHSRHLCSTFSWKS